MRNYNSIVVLGPTASGKTALACRLAYELNGEIISADSRQVYKGLDIGTGKDLHEYIVKDHIIPHHLIDVCSPDQQFYLHDFIRECDKAFEQILLRHHVPVICGGTGLYLDALIKDFSLTLIPENEALRSTLISMRKDQLLQRLSSYPTQLTKHADLTSVKRIIRAIEIAEFLVSHPDHHYSTPRPFRPYYIGVITDVNARRQRIQQRLNVRLNNGMIEEVERLLSEGVTHERLQRLGLEYKFISMYLILVTDYNKRN